MELDRSTVRRLAREYENEEALYGVERKHLDILPEMYADGEFGWRDVEWVVRWYYRRFLGAFPNQKRRAIEERFGGNSYEDVRDAFEAVFDAEDVTEKVARLTDLDAVDVPLASGYLMFIDPDSFVVMGEREWTVLHRSGLLDDPYPDDPTPGDYERYLAVCRDLATDLDCELWTLYRALWRRYKTDEGLEA